MKLFIDGKGKLGHLTGEVRKPADDPNLKAWGSENSMITAWHIHSMNPSIGKPLFIPTVKEVWEAVQDTYFDLENSSQIFDHKTHL